MNKLKFFAFALVVFIAGCAGTAFKWDQARQIKEGMTEPELYNLMGQPYMVTASQKGTILVWSYADAFSGAKSVSVIVKDGKVVKAPAIPQSFD